MPACRPAGDFENKTSTAPKLGLGLGAELGKNRNFRMEYFPDLQMPQTDKNIPGIQELELFDKYTEAPVLNRLILIIMKTHPWLSFVIKIIQLYQVVMMMDYSTIWLL